MFMKLIVRFNIGVRGGRCNGSMPDLETDPTCLFLYNRPGPNSDEINWTRPNSNPPQAKAFIYLSFMTRVSSRHLSNRWRTHTGVSMLLSYIYIYIYSIF